MEKLSTEEMAEVISIFSDCVLHSLGNYVGETRQQLSMFINEVTLREKPYLLVSEEGLPRAIDLVFSDEHIRDFIFTLHYNFFSRWGRSDEDTYALISILARGVSLRDDEKASGLSAMPEQIINRLPTRSDVYDLLINNEWLVILLLILLSTSTNIPNELTRK